MFDDAAFDHLVGDLPLGPVADGAPRGFGRLTGHGHDGADLLGGDAWPLARTWGIAEAVLKAQFGQRDRSEQHPPSSPEVDRVGADLEGLGDGGVTLTVGGSQDNPGAQDQLLGGQVALEEGLQRLALFVGEFDRQGFGATHDPPCG